VQSCYTLRAKFVYLGTAPSVSSSQATRIAFFLVHVKWRSRPVTLRRSHRDKVVCYYYTTRPWCVVSVTLRQWTFWINRVTSCPYLLTSNNALNWWIIWELHPSVILIASEATTLSSPITRKWHAASVLPGERLVLEACLHAGARRMVADP
jgi:hypothetical protein